MVRRCLLVAIALGAGLGLAVALPSPAAENKTDAGRIAKLIDQLGSPKFTERADAMKELEKIGVPALRALRTATKSNDAETRRRSEEVGWNLGMVQAADGKLGPFKFGLLEKGAVVVGAGQVVETLGSGLQIVARPLAKPGLAEAQDGADVPDISAAEAELDGALARG